MTWKIRGREYGLNTVLDYPEIWRVSVRFMPATGIRPLTWIVLGQYAFVAWTVSVVFSGRHATCYADVARAASRISMTIDQTLPRHFRTVAPAVARTFIGVE